MKQFLQKFTLLGSTLVLLLFTGIVPAFADASGSNNCAEGTDSQTSCFVPPVVSLQAEFGFNNLGQAINTIITAVMFFAAVIAFVFIVIGAFRYVSAGEDAAGTTAARKIITNAVVGLILLALVYVIFQIVIRIVPGLSDFFVAGQT